MNAATDKLSIALRAISDPSRRKIISLLKRAGAQEDGLTATDLELKLKVAQPTVSHHMKVLRKANLIKLKESGTWVHYTLNQAALRELSRSVESELR